METLQEEINALRKAIIWWQKSLEQETSKLQRETKGAIIRRLKHKWRILREEIAGISLLDKWKNIRDTAIDTYDDLAGHIAESFNEVFLDEVPPPDSVAPSEKKTLKSVTPKE